MTDKLARLDRMRALYHELAHASLTYNDGRRDTAYRSLEKAAHMLLDGAEVAIMDTARVAALIPGARDGAEQWEHQHERELAAAVRVAIVNADYSALRHWGQS